MNRCDWLLYLYLFIFFWDRVASIFDINEWRREAKNSVVILEKLNRQKEIFHWMPIDFRALNYPNEIGFEIGFMDDGFF